MWDLPGPGHEPVAPALAGGFLTTAPPGKPSLLLFYPPNPTAFHLGVTKKLLKIEALDEEQGSGT